MQQRVGHRGVNHFARTVVNHFSSVNTLVSQLFLEPKIVSPGTRTIDRNGLLKPCILDVPREKLLPICCAKRARGSTPNSTMTHNLSGGHSLKEAHHKQTQAHPEEVRRMPPLFETLS